ncbi:MAG TPA: stalk domain-containing protein, partial [Caldisericia bacterium]|nr:stalk domain-containing protein [Caldisericia bacterium]
TPTGNGTDTMSVDLYQEAISGWFPLSHAYNLARFDVIMSLQVVADTSEPLRVGKDGTLTVYVQETTGKPVSGATVHIKGAGVESEKKSDKDGKVVFNVRPTERGRIIIEASMENGMMKGSYTTVFVESYVEPPMLDLDPVQSIVSSGSLQVSGRTNQGTRITINGKPVQVSQDGKFTFTAKLNEGVNTIVVQATNQTGQTVTKVIRVESRTQPSGIIIDPLGDYENVTVIRVRGHVEPGCKVTITSDADGKAVEAVVSNDVFVADVAVKEGNNNITVEATDVVGKKSNKSATVYVFKKVHVQLQIDSLVMVINGVPTRLAVAPRLIGGSTMVPFRVIAEAFGATADYDGATKKITVKWENNVLEMVIGNKQATLNGNPITLAQAPQIIGGSTMVPLRFVENFGNVEVVYNSASKTIDIIRRK